MLIYTNVFKKEINKVKIAIERLRAHEPEEGCYLTFSGGKDSVVIKALADMAGVKYDAHYNNTTIDPKEWRWRLRAKNDKIIASGEGYKTHAEVLRSGGYKGIQAIKNIKRYWNN